MVGSTRFAKSTWGLNSEKSARWRDCDATPAMGA